ncbi:MAG: hypothetical protein FWE25_08770 [Lachnospiraceae bacterium]|nr:hypothetical protein [Lachnospiraceae bacterium]
MLALNRSNNIVEGFMQGLTYVRYPSFFVGNNQIFKRDERSDMEKIRDDFNIVSEDIRKEAIKFECSNK